MKSLNRSMLAFSLVLGLSVLTALTPIAQANHGHHGKPHDHGHGAYSSRYYAPDRGWNNFNANQISLIQQALRNNQNQWFDALAWQSIQNQYSLPPGILKQLQRGRPLPPGLSQQIIYVPNQSMSVLGYPNGGPYKVGVIGNQVILYNSNTGLILDVIRNILLN